MRGAKIALGAVALLVGLLLCELVLSRVAPQLFRRPRLWQYDPELGWGHIPLSSGTMVGPEYEVEMRINAEGLRDREYARAKKPGVRRILFFGDSFVEGWGVCLEESVGKRLEVRLGRALPVEVINFGVAGYGTDQELLFFEKLGAAYQPDQVVLLFYANDLINNATRKGIGAERGYKPYFRLRGGALQLRGVPVKKTAYWERRNLPWRRRLGSYLYEHWHLYALLRKAFAPAVDPRQRQLFYEALYGTGRIPQVERTWELTGRLLEAFRRQVEQAGARMLLVYAPAIVQIEDENWRSKHALYDLVGAFDLRGPDRRLARLAARYGIPFLDLYPSFKEAAGKQTLYYRESHWNARGHALAAEKIGEFLLRQEGRGD